MSHERHVTCREFVELATALHEDVLPPEELDLVEEHLVMCDWCRDYLRQYEATVEALHAAPAEEPEPEMLEFVVAAFRAARDGEG